MADPPSTPSGVAGQAPAESRGKDTTTQAGFKKNLKYFYLIIKSVVAETDIQHNGSCTGDAVREEPPAMLGHVATPVCEQKVLLPLPTPNPRTSGISQIVSFCA